MFLFVDRSLMASVKKLLRLVLWRTIPTAARVRSAQGVPPPAHWLQRVPVWMQFSLLMGLAVQVWSFNPVFQEICETLDCYSIFISANHLRRLNCIQSPWKLQILPIPVWTLTLGYVVSNLKIWNLWTCVVWFWKLKVKRSSGNWIHALAVTLSWNLRCIIQIVANIRRWIIINVVSLYDQFYLFTAMERHQWQDCCSKWWRTSFILDWARRIQEATFASPVYIVFKKVDLILRKGAPRNLSPHHCTPTTRRPCSIGMCYVWTWLWGVLWIFKISGLSRICSLLQTLLCKSVV
jgi:hypothetical protein